MAKFLELTSKWCNREKLINLLFDDTNNKISDVISQDISLQESQERIVNTWQILN